MSAFIGVMMLALALASDRRAEALFTGLVQIPTAGCLTPGTYELTLEVDVGAGNNNTTAIVADTQFGLMPRVEAGVDFDLGLGADSVALPNVKYLVATNSKQTWGAALGVFTLSVAQRSAAYAVVSQSIGAGDAHLGLLHVAHRNRSFAGLDWSISDRYVFMGDYVSGEGNYSSLGVQYNVSDRFNVLAGVLFPNTGGFDTQYTVQFTLVGPYTVD
jgi:hypothetical protein